MARRQTRSAGPTVAERLAAVETALLSIPEAIKAGISEALREVPMREEHTNLAAIVERLRDQVGRLESANAYSAGATKAEQRGESRFDAYAKQLVPYFLGLCALAYPFLDKLGG